MVAIELTLTLPDDLAREAAARGLLTPHALQQLIDAEVERRRKLDQTIPIFTAAAFLTHLAHTD